MTIYIDNFKSRSALTKSIAIPIPEPRKGQTVKLYHKESPTTSSHSTGTARSLHCSISDISGELVTGQVLRTPPKSKAYNKWDYVIFTKDRICGVMK